MLFLLCILFAHIFITYGMYDNETKEILIQVLVLSMIALVLFIVITVQTIIKRYDDSKANCEAKTIKYIEFSNKDVTVCYNDNAMFKIVYKDIDEMKLIFKTQHFFYHRLLGITNVELQLKYNYNKESKSFKVNIPASYTLFDKIFKIVYFSQYVSGFSIQSNAQHKEELQKTLGKALEAYKENNYKHTFRSFGYTIWAIPILVITVILLFLALFLVGYLIATGII